MSNEFEAIKKPHVKTDYSEQMLEELIACEEDPVYFIENFVKVQHPMLGAQPLILHPFQKELISAFHNNRWSISMCARQLGKTTCAAAYLLWKAMFTPDVTILIVANKYVQALEIVDRIRFGYENCPDHIRSGVTEYNKGTIAFDNGSRIVSRATSADAGRGLSISLLYCDEFAFVMPNKAREFWTSIQPTLSTGGGCIITSTPKSDEDQFAQIWKSAINNTDDYGNILPHGRGRNDFFPVEIPWWRHPDRNEEWAKPFRESLGEARFRQEFENAFITDDLTLIDPLCLVRLSGMKEPIYYTDTVRWFVEPEPNKAYLVALDPSMGVGRDYAAIQVFSIPDMIQVAEWQHNKSAPRRQVAVLKGVLDSLYCDLASHPEQIADPEIFWTVENNSLGEAILTIIEDTGEENFYGEMINERKRKGQARGRFRKGLTTDHRKKLSACARLKSLIERDRLKINSPNLIRELKNFVSKETSFSAKPGEHDDLVSAVLLIVRMIDVVTAQGIEAGEAMREAIDDDELLDEDGPMPIAF